MPASGSRFLERPPPVGFSGIVPGVFTRVVAK
jgi:hypothetical protein